MFCLKRYEKNPILEPDANREWENHCVTNPGAWLDGDTFILLYRAGPNTDEHPIYFGMATSTNGYDFERVSDTPVFGPCPGSFDGGCVEDARIIKFGDTFFVTYATRMFYPGSYWTKEIALNGHNPDLPEETPLAIQANLTRTGLAATKDFNTWYRLGPITPATVDDRDAIIFPGKSGGQFVMIHRPIDWTGPEYGCEKPSIWLALSDDMLSWKESHLLAQPKYAWEAQKIGGSTPPLHTEEGWLTLYHGVDDAGIYRVGVMLLDHENPLKILARLPYPILQPEEPYETEGVVSNVVFPCGNCIKGGTLFVYYGGADRCCAVATAPVQELLDTLREHPWPH
jgi:predicted GH43/DUF377 family glycosyl hydrolase